MRVGIFADLVYRRDDRGVSTDLSFARFLCALGETLEEVVIFGRLDPTAGRSAWAIEGRNVRFVPLPFYSSLRAPTDVVRSWRTTRRILDTEILRSCDALLVFGPHPYSLWLARTVRPMLPVILGVRQNFVEYVARRATSVSERVTVLSAVLLDALWRRTAHSHPTMVVGEALARQYARGGASVYMTGISVVSARDLSEPGEGRRVAGQILSVGRLDPEKNPLLLPRVLAALREVDDSWTMVVAGDGRCRAAVEESAERLGVSAFLAILGTLDQRRLRQLYEESDVFLHVSHTEGVPQVLYEAAAARIPIVATAVGGVTDAMEGGRLGILIPPHDVYAAAAAVQRARFDGAHRVRTVDRAAAWVANETMEAQAARFATWIRSVTSV